MRFLLYSLCLCVLAVGCSDTSGGGAPLSSGPHGPDAVPNSGDIAVLVTTPADPAPVYDPRRALHFVGNDGAQMNYYNAGAFTVRYLNADGAAIRGGQVQAGFAGSQADMVLSAPQFTTNAQGEATVTFETGRQSGTYRIVVSAERATDLVFTVEVRPKDSASYLVHTLYPETATLPLQVSVRLLNDAIDCRDLDPAALPAELHQFDILPHDNEIPDARFVGLANGSAYTVVSVGYLAPEVPVAFGCNDDRPPIADGFDQEITVEMAEIVPLVQGTWDIETRVDLLDALPEPWSSNLTLLGRIFAEPDQVLMELLLGDPNISDDGFLGEIIPDNRILRAALAQAITELLADLLPPELQEVFRVGGMVYRTVSQFTLQGHLDIVGEPGTDGALPTDNVHRYGTIVVHWDRDIVLHMNDLDDVGALNGLWAGSVGRSALDIDRHSLRFNYGALVLALIEQIVLPSIFGQGVNSIAEAVESFVDCQQLANNIFDPVTDPLLNQIVYFSCLESVEELADIVTDAFLGESTPLTNLTFAADGCSLQEPTGYDRDDQVRYFQTLGAEAERCVWDTQLDVDGDIRAIDADFFGELQ